MFDFIAEKLKDADQYGFYPSDTEYFQLSVGKKCDNTRSHPL